MALGTNNGIWAKISRSSYSRFLTRVEVVVLSVAHNVALAETSSLHPTHYRSNLAVGYVSYSKPASHTNKF